MDQKKEWLLIKGRLIHSAFVCLSTIVAAIVGAGLVLLGLLIIPKQYELAQICLATIMVTLPISVLLYTAEGKVTTLFTIIGLIMALSMTILCSGSINHSQSLYGVSIGLSSTASFLLFYRLLVLKFFRWASQHLPFPCQY